MIRIVFSEVSETRLKLEEANVYLCVLSEAEFGSD